MAEIQETLSVVSKGGVEMLKQFWDWLMETDDGWDYGALKHSGVFILLFIGLFILLIALFSR